MYTYIKVGQKNNYVSWCADSTQATATHVKVVPKLFILLLYYSCMLACLSKDSLVFLPVHMGHLLHIRLHHQEIPETCYLEHILVCQVYLKRQCCFL